MPSDPVPLTLANVLRTLARHTGNEFLQQVSDPSRPDCGGVFAEYSGVDEPAATAPLVAACGLLYIAAVERGLPTSIAPATLLQRAVSGIDYLVRFRRPSGLIDLRNVNYDSSPDTGFAVQLLCTIVELGRPLAGNDADWAVFLDKLAGFIRPAVGGMLSGGFHTPNQRWVIVSALAQAAALYPDLDVRSVVDAYLAEGFDIDSEGAFVERSVGVYDAVCDRSLLLIAEHMHCPEARLAARRNLELDLRLLHADGTAETGLSRRQDYGTRTVPLPLAAGYLLSHHTAPNPTFVAAAQMLWEKATSQEGTLYTPRLGDFVWLAQALLAHGEPDAVTAPLPTDFAKYFPHNGLWRVRRDLLSATFFRNVTRLLTLQFGRAELSSLKISQSYFGDGLFIAESLAPAGNGVVLHSSGSQRPHRPGYELPLGRPVPAEGWSNINLEREWKPIAPATSSLTVHEAAGGFELHYQTLNGLDRVPAQIALDFPPGGIWETDDSCVRPQTGQVIFLKRGYGTMRFAADTIRIGPGADGHRAWAMRQSEQASSHVRVLITFTTPVDHTITITGRRG